MWCILSPFTGELQCYVCPNFYGEGVFYPPLRGNYNEILYIRSGSLLYLIPLYGGITM